MQISLITGKLFMSLPFILAWTVKVNSFYSLLIVNQDTIKWNIKFASQHVVVYILDFQIRLFKIEVLASQKSDWLPVASGLLLDMLHNSSSRCEKMYSTVLTKWDIRLLPFIIQGDSIYLCLVNAMQVLDLLQKQLCKCLIMEKMHSTFKSTDTNIERQQASSDQLNKFLQLRCQRILPSHIKLKQNTIPVLPICLISHLFTLVRSIKSGSHWFANSLRMFQGVIQQSWPAVSLEIGHLH